MKRTLTAVLAISLTLSAPLAAEAGQASKAIKNDKSHSSSWYHKKGLSVKTKWVASKKPSKLTCLKGYEVNPPNDFGVYFGCKKSLKP